MPTYGEEGIDGIHEFHCKEKASDKIYLYESLSDRNAEGKLRNNCILIGKIDPVTGNPVYKSEYLAR
jgi:hypothetical protein